ncbi:MAG: hypothetical protein CME62_15110 [Halobacteriovoraceae bacterium]|nr:hypothetical protein [Halobacteriovoraceae bacterium]|tara:strand:- start:21812 stop:22957 length:1146 start_codon:yes stop_codon:yes gene_type:complete
MQKLSVLFICLFNLNLALAHLSDDESHRRLSDPLRIEYNKQTKDLDDPDDTSQLCRDTLECVRTQEISDLSGNVIQATRWLAELETDMAVRHSQADLERIYRSCRDLTHSEEVAEVASQIENTHWIHGAQNCNENDDPEMQVESMGMGLTIIRQNKCETAEAPFLYLFETEDKVTLIDTGDIWDESSLYDQVAEIAGDREIVIAHSHDHGDHTLGDHQFRDKENVTFIDASMRDGKHSVYGIENWPEDIGTLDIGGGRSLQVIPVPGHENSSVAFYDPETQMMITGDVMYPGRLYINDYPAFVNSLARMREFSQNNPVSGYLGGHVEMSTEPGEDIPFGNYAPNERSLLLKNSDLEELYQAALRNGQDQDVVTLDNFIIRP